MHLDWVSAAEWAQGFLRFQLKQTNLGDRLSLPLFYNLVNAVKTVEVHFLAGSYLKKYPNASSIDS